MRCWDVFEAAVAHNSAPCSDPAASSEALRPKLLAPLSGAVPACSTVGGYEAERKCRAQGFRVRCSAVSG